MEVETEQPTNGKGAVPLPLEAHADAVKAFVDAPPAFAAGVAFQYRQTAARRVATENKVRQLRAALEGADRDLLTLRGAESALHDAVCSLAGIDPRVAK